MSLIVARATPTNLVLVSDTKVSSTFEAGTQSSADVPSHYGVLKLIVIQPTIVVGIAGALDCAEKAIKEVSSHPDRASDILLDHHRSSNGTVDFILATANGALNLACIKDGSIKQLLSTAWIGSQVGFTQFQGYLHGAIKPPTDPFNPTTFVASRTVQSGKEDSAIYESLMGAMQGVVDSGVDRTVDGLPIGVAFENNRFHYQHRTTVHRGILTFDFQNEKPQVLDFGNATQGSHIVEIAPCDSITGAALCMYHKHGKVGICYPRRENGLPYPTMYPGVDDLTFILLMRINHSISCNRFSIGGSLDYYDSRCGQLVKACMYEEVDPLLDLAIKHFEKDKKRWVLLKTRALGSINRGRFVRAVRDMTKVIQAAPLEKANYLLRGNAYAQICQSLNRETLELAERDYLMALRLSPDYAPARAKLNLLRRNRAMLPVEG